MDQACLIVGWNKYDDYWYLEYFEMSDDTCIYHRNDGLWAWKEEGAQEDLGFFFVLPIFALNDEEDVRKFVVTPFRELFEADRPHEIASRALNNIPVLVPRAA